MMSNKLKSIDQTTKDAVFGYIRSYQKLTHGNEYALFQNIPIGISSLCTLYLGTIEYFKLFDDQQVMISDDGKSIRKIMGKRDWQNTSYGTVEISSTSKYVYKWYIKIGNNDNDGRCIIGLATEPFTINTAFDEDRTNKHYCFATNNGQKKDYKSMDFMSYGERIGEGRVLCIELDLKQGCIKFGEQGYEWNTKVAFKRIKIGEDISYRLAVSMYEVDCQISIIKFERF